MKTKILNKFSKLILSTTLIASLVTPVIAQGYFVVTTPNYKERQQYNFTLKPGEKIQDQLKVRSVLDQPIKVKVYGIDAITSGSGTFSMSVPSRPQRTLGKWTSFEENEFTLEPKETKFINFTISVPETAPPGSYAGGMIAETDSSSGREITSNGGGNTVKSSARIALKAFVDVPGDKTFKLNLKEFSHNETTRFNNFNILLENQGNTIVKAESSIHITGFGYDQTEKADNIIIFQQETTPFAIKWKKEQIIDLFDTRSPIKDLFEINKPFFGNFDAELTVKYAMYDLSSNTYADEQIITKKISFWVIPKGIIIIIIGLFTITILYFGIKKIRLNQLKKRCSPYIVKEGDTLINIAQSHNISWKNLAKANNLTPPYSLTPGSTILAPTPKTPPPTQNPPTTPIQATTPPAQPVQNPTPTAPPQTTPSPTQVPPPNQNTQTPPTQTPPPPQNPPLN